MKNQEQFFEKKKVEMPTEYAPKKEQVEFLAQNPVLDTIAQQKRLKRQIETMNFPEENKPARELVRAVPKAIAKTAEKPGLWNMIVRYFEERKQKREFREVKRFEENAFSTFDYLLEERKSETVFGVKIKDVLQALAGEDGPKAEEMRERYKTDMEYWEDITLSYTGIDTPPAREWREKVIKMGEENKMYQKLAQAALVSLAGIDTDWAKDMRERGAKLCGDAEREYIGKSYRGINNEEANEWRENLMEKYKEFMPQKEKLYFERKACDEQGDQRGYENREKEIEKLYEKYPHIYEAPELIAESLGGVQSKETDEMLAWCFKQMFEKENQHKNSFFVATSALVGRNDDFALQLQDQIKGGCPDALIVEILAGRDDKNAWEMREKFFKQHTISEGRTVDGVPYDSNSMPHWLASLARSLAGIKTKKAENWRKSLLERKHHGGGFGISNVGVARDGIAQSFFGNPNTVAYKFLKKNNSETTSKIHLPEIKSTMPIQEQISAAESIMGHENVRGPWSVGINIDMEKLPSIPFTAEKLAQAKERGAYLKYQTPDDEKGVPMTIEYLIDRFGEKLKSNGYGDIVINAHRHKEHGDSTFSSDSPRKGWFLTETRPVPFSAGKSEVEQTELMIAYLKETLFEGEKLPEYYEKAIKEFEKQKDKILKLLADGETRVEGCRILEELHITQLLRPWPVEIIMDQVAYGMASKKYLHEGMNILTGRQSPNTGHFVTVTGSDKLNMGSIVGIPIRNNTAEETIISRQI